MAEDDGRPARIHTARLYLVALLPQELAALIAGDTDQASKAAGVNFLPGWPESKDAREGLPWHLGHLEADDRHRAWRVRVVVERATSAVVGSVNLKGPPDGHGDVEIGWGIIEAKRRRGYALEAASELINWVVAQSGTRSLSATINDDNIASQQLAEKLGFSRASELRRGIPLWRRGAACESDG